MAEATAAAQAHMHPRPERPALGAGALATTYVSLVVLIPLAALVARAEVGGPAAFWRVATAPEALAALELTLALALAVGLLDAVVGTAIAWVLVRDRFAGRSVLDAVLDLPFALPTIVSGLTLLALYGPGGVGGVDIAYTRLGVLMALLFVTLPFVVRSVQPVLLALDWDMEEAAEMLGASRIAVWWRIVLPHLMPGVLAGAGLAFARAVGEFGSVVLISGNLPFRTEVASVFIFGHLASDDIAGASALSVLLLATSLVVLGLVGALQRGGGPRGR